MNEWYLRKSIHVAVQFNLSSPKHFKFVKQLCLSHMFSTHYIQATVISLVMYTKHSQMASYFTTAKI